MYKEVFRGYSTFHSALINSAVALLAKCGCAEDLALGRSVDIQQFQDDPNITVPHYLTASLNFLLCQGILAKSGKAYIATTKGRELFLKAQSIANAVDQYELIIYILEQLLGWRSISPSR